MYQLKVNSKYNFETGREEEGLLLNGIKNRADLKKIHEGLYHVIHNNRSYTVEIVSFNQADKIAEVKVNNNAYTITAKDQFDILLDQLGLSNLNTIRVSEIKAPMPGLVLKVFAAKGDVTKKGENLFILEAMKMENIIKAPADVVIEKLLIKPGDKVEKGQILILF